MLCEDNVMGKLSDERFMKLSADYEAEQQELGDATKLLDKEIESEVGQMVDADKFIALAEKYSQISELTATLLNELVEKIVIHSPIKENGIKHITIEVYFIHVGKISIPRSRKREENATIVKPA